MNPMDTLTQSQRDAVATWWRIVRRNRRMEATGASPTSADDAAMARERESDALDCCRSLGIDPMQALRDEASGCTVSILPSRVHGLATRAARLAILDGVATLHYVDGTTESAPASSIPAGGTWFEIVDAVQGHRGKGAVTP